MAPTVPLNAKIATPAYEYRKGSAPCLVYLRIGFGCCWRFPRLDFPHRLQRWTYAVAVLTLLHWAALHDWGGIGPALVHFAPLGLLEAYRAWY